MKTVKILILFLLTISEINIAQESTQIKSIVGINMDKSIGLIRPLHGGNNCTVSALKVLDFKLANSFLEVPVKYELYSVDETHNFSIVNSYEI